MLGLVQQIQQVVALTNCTRFPMPPSVPPQQRPDTASQETGLFVLEGGTPAGASPLVTRHEGAMEPWRQCYHEMAGKLLLFARQFLSSGGQGCINEAEDVVQNAFVRFWKHYPEAQADQYGLLFAAVRTLSLDFLRGAKRRSKREEVYAQEQSVIREDFEGRSGPWFESGADSSAQSEIVQTALSRIPAEQREVVVLKLWGELTFAQIAETVEAPASTVATRYRTGMKKLREELEEDENG